MKRILIAGLMLGASMASAQSLEDLNIQLHGYAAQGGLYSNHNSWNTTDSNNGSAAWSDVVVNLSAQPETRLRVGMQARYSILGDFGKSFTLDWAQADYKVDERLGVRVGKVKTPVGLLNESQDIDPAQLWILLPQSMYPIASRNALLAHYGGVLYGAFPIGEKWGKLEYRGFGGQRILAADDGYFQPLRDQGIIVPKGISGHTGGGTLKWITPVQGLVAGFSENSGGPSGEAVAGPYSGMLDVTKFRQTFYFAKYDHDKLMLAGEYSRFQALTSLQLTGLPTVLYDTDARPWYVMASYKATSKLTGGLYFSSIFDHRTPLGPSRYQKDWAVTARYDISPFFYAKLEQHWMDGTNIGYSLSDNPSLQPTMRLSLLKLGVSF